MFGVAMRHRGREAALRDISSVSASTRAQALADLVAYVDEDRAEVIGALERGLSDTAREVRAASAVGLADVRATESLPALLFAVEDDDPYVRQMALSAVGELGDARAQERLRRALSDPRAEVRFQAVIGFTRVAPEEAPVALLHALVDVDPSIRYIALRSAEELAESTGKPSPRDFLKKAEELLADDSHAVRIAAAIVLAPRGNAASRQVLVDVVKGELRTAEGEDEAAAIELSGELRLSGAIPYLERRAFGVFAFRADRFAWQALVALARFGHPRAHARIERDLRSWSRHRRTMAVVAAGHAGVLELRPLIVAMQGDARRADPGAVALALEQLGLAEEAKMAGESAKAQSLGDREAGTERSGVRENAF